MSDQPAAPLPPSTPPLPPHVPVWRRALAAVGRVLALLVGRWVPPPWLVWVVRRPFVAADRMRGWGRQQWSKALLGPVLVGAALVGVRAYKDWKARQPQPTTFSVSVRAPGLTPLRQDARPDSLRLVFGGSAAPLAGVGKPVSVGVALSPAHPGDWSWADDHTLRFVPAQDWPVDQAFTVTLDPKTLVAPHVLLEAEKLNFKTPPFACRLGATEFYQDPVDPKIKKVVATVVFTHPVDPAELQKRISLTFLEKQGGMRAPKNMPYQFRVTYDAFKGEAYIHSDTVPMPERDSTMALVVDEGTRSARGGNACAGTLRWSTRVPGMYSYFHINDVTTTFVRNEKFDPEQVLLITASAGVTEKELQGHFQAWLLPQDRPAMRQRPAVKGYRWHSPNEIGPEVLKAATPLPLEAIPTDSEFARLHSFRITAPVGRQLYVRLQKGMVSYGGYVLGQEVARVVSVPPYPKELAIMHDGAILTLSGQHKMNVLSRGLEGIEFDVARILSTEVNHLISQTSGDFKNPSFHTSSFGPDNISQRFTKHHDLRHADPSQTQYTALDFSAYLGRPPRHGLFWLRVRRWTPPGFTGFVAPTRPSAEEEDEQDQDSAEADQDEEGAADEDAEADGADLDTVSDDEGGHEADEDEEYADSDDQEDRYAYRHSRGAQDRANEQRRLVLVTDLGMLVKDNANGTHEVYVQSLSNGEPVSGATVSVLGKNGLAVLTRTTDATGHASVPVLHSYSREKTPVAYLVTRGDDLSFLPLGRYDRVVNLSRFDVGGMRSSGRGGSLDAYLFSDRGIYRPGDTVHVGAVVKPVDWSRDVAGMPLEAVVSDPRGMEVDRQKVSLPADGFVEFSYVTHDASPTGGWNVALFVVRDGRRAALLGNVGVRVEEFLPDRMKITAAFSSGPTRGWVSPEDLTGVVDLQNLFGVPAQHHKVRASLVLTQASPRFPGYRDYSFHDPLRPRTGENRALGEQQTNEKGQVDFDLELEELEAATWQARLVAEGFELEGGRSVHADASIMVSPLAYMVGYKADGSLAYLKKGSTRTVSFVAVGPDLKKVAAPALTAQLIQEQYVSVLTRQSNGTYRYESVLRKSQVSQAALRLSSKGAELGLDTRKPGDFILKVLDHADQQVALLRYSVVGEANVAGNLEKNAELQVRTNRSDYAPGDTLEIQVVAPYTGAGLITVERDKVYSHRWFKASTTSSVHTLAVPPGLEGNGYVHVSFVRAPDSPEVYMSPMSYGVVPFTVARDKRTVKIRVQTADRVAPGEPLMLRYSTSVPSRLALYAVDEGILQVAGYKTPDPLGHFFRKRALEVRTLQILDLLLPEVAEVNNSGSGGGEGGEEALGANLNPFKRQQERPAAYWSGLIDADATERQLTYELPPSFNGSVRVMAVAVSKNAVGVAERKTLVRGDFVMAPNVPTFLAPGDQADVTLAVTNTLEGSGANANPTVTLAVSPELELLDGATRTLKLAEGAEASVRFRVKATSKLGGATLTFTTALGDKKNTYRSSLSVRPPSPFVTTLAGGSFQDSSVETPVGRKIYPHHRVLEASASPLPLTLAGGLLKYLRRYPYGCTEQLVSQAFPAVILKARPEFGMAPAEVEQSLGEAILMLRSRQNSQGAFGFWAANSFVSPFHAVYAAHFLLEARQRSFAVPQDLWIRTLDYVRKLAATESDTPQMARTRAYALYVLTRAQEVHANHLASVKAELVRAEKKFGASTDLAWAYVAAVHKMLKQDKDALEVIKKLHLGDKVTSDYGAFYDSSVRDAQLLYLVSLHFPEVVPLITAKHLAGFANLLLGGSYNSLSSAYAIMGLDAYATAVGTPQPGAIVLSALMASGKPTPLALPATLFATTGFSPDASKLKFEAHQPFNVFWSVTQAGFDVDLPTQPIGKGLEVTRLIRNADGNEVAQTHIGDELLVELRLRTTDKGSVPNAAVVELLPAGFEVVQNPGASGGVYRVVQSGSSWRPEYADVREDRVVLYGTISSSVQTFVYRIKATNAGSFKVPPPFAESMYDRSRLARGVGSAMVVTR